MAGSAFGKGSLVMFVSEFLMFFLAKVLFGHFLFLMFLRFFSGRGSLVFFFVSFCLLVFGGFCESFLRKLGGF